MLELKQNDELGHREKRKKLISKKEKPVLFKQFASTLLTPSDNKINNDSNNDSDNLNNINLSKFEKKFLKFKQSEKADLGLDNFQNILNVKPKKDKLDIPINFKQHLINKKGINLNPAMNYTLNPKLTQYNQNIILVSYNSESELNDNVSNHKEPDKKPSFYSIIKDEIIDQSNNVLKIIDLKKELKQTKKQLYKKQLSMDIDSDPDDSKRNLSKHNSRKNILMLKDNKNKESLNTRELNSSLRGKHSRNSSSESQKRVSFKDQIEEVKLVPSYKENQSDTKDRNLDNNNFNVNINVNVSKFDENKVDSKSKGKNKLNSCSCGCIVF